MSEVNEQIALLNQHNFMANRLQKLEEENKTIKTEYNRSIDLLANSIEEKLKNRIETAKELKKVAIEEADAERQVLLDEELVTAIRDQKSFEEKKEQFKPYDVSDTETIEKAQNQQAWIEANKEILADQKIAEEVQAQSLLLEKRLIESGQQDLIYSKEYWNVMERIKNDALAKRQKTSFTPQRQSRGQPSAMRKDKIALDEDEREYLALTGISPEKYIKAKQQNLGR